MYTHCVPLKLTVGEELFFLQFCNVEDGGLADSSSFLWFLGELAKSQSL